MPTKPLTREQMQEAINMYELHGTTAAAMQMDIKISTLNHRVREAKRLGIEPAVKKTPKYSNGNAILHTDVEDGVILVGSDAHYWPGIVTTAHKAFVKFAKHLKPKIIVLNGDVVDGAQNSRWPSIGWEKKPTVDDELKAANERLDEILSASPSSLFVWPAGNHDSRFESRLAQVAPEYKGVRGIHLKDHFSERWHPCWRLDVNETCVIKHKEKGGVHATFNNTVKSGKTVVTGHLHSLKVYPFSDDNLHTRWGVDCGTLAERKGPQFIQYTEASTTLDWRSGFVVLTFHKGRLLWPEVVAKHDDNSVEWRGQVIDVG